MRCVEQHQDVQRAERMSVCTVGVGAVLNGYRAITDHEALKDARRPLDLRI
jgi:hypothetical protein